MKKIYAIFDKKAEVFRFEFFSDSHGQAIRNFMTGCEDKNTEIGKYKEDFVLYYLGTISDYGKIELPEHPQELSSGLEINKSEEQT
jgi:hypothetical protein